MKNNKLNKRLYGYKKIKKIISFSIPFASHSRACKLPRKFSTPSLFKSSPSSNHLFIWYLREKFLELHWQEKRDELSFLFLSWKMTLQSFRTLKLLGTKIEPPMENCSLIYAIPGTYVPNLKLLGKKLLVLLKVTVYLGLMS